MASADDVQLPDLLVIQRYSLAVRGAAAPREDVIAALREDLDWLTTGTRPKPVRAPKAPAKPAVTKAPAKKAPAKPAAKAPAKKAPAKKRA